MSAPDLAAELREADRLIKQVSNVLACSALAIPTSDLFAIIDWRARNAAVLRPAEPLAKPPFQPGDWVVYHKAVANGGRATRVDAVKFDTLIPAWVWRKARTPDVAAFWRRCADYRARARDIAEPEEAKNGEPDVLPVGTKVKIKRQNGSYYFGDKALLTVSGVIYPFAGPDSLGPPHYYFREGVGSWPRESLEVVELPEGAG